MSNRINTQSTPFTYDPERLLNTLMERMGWHNDTALSRELGVSTQMIHNIRKRRFPLPASLLLWIVERTGASIEELRHILGDRRAKFRLSYAII